MRMLPPSVALPPESSALSTLTNTRPETSTSRPPPALAISATCCSVNVRVEAPAFWMVKAFEEGSEIVVRWPAIGSGSVQVPKPPTISTVPATLRSMLIGAEIVCAGLVFTMMRSLAMPFATAWATASAIVA